MMRYCLLIILLLVCRPALAESPLYGAGSWRNDRVGTTGKLTCAIVMIGNETWRGMFNGEFQGEGFSYTVTFRGVASDLRGRALINGYTYTWTGTVLDGYFKGQFESLRGNPPRRGNHGSFFLTRTAAPK